MEKKKVVIIKPKDFLFKVNVLSYIYFLLQSDLDCEILRKCGYMFEALKWCQYKPSGISSTSGRKTCLCQCCCRSEAGTHTSANKQTPVIWTNHSVFVVNSLYPNLIWLVTPWRGRTFLGIGMEKIMCCPQHSCRLYTRKFLLLGVIGPNTKPSVSLFWPHFVVA